MERAAKTEWVVDWCVSVCSTNVENAACLMLEFHSKGFTGAWARSRRHGPPLRKTKVALGRWVQVVRQRGLYCVVGYRCNVIGEIGRYPRVVFVPPRGPRLGRKVQICGIYDSAGKLTLWCHKFNVHNRSWNCEPTGYSHMDVIESRAAPLSCSELHGRKKALFFSGG